MTTTDTRTWQPDPTVPGLPDHWVNPAWPHWHAWKGVAGLYYARRPKSSPPKVVRADSLDGLSDALG